MEPLNLEIVKPQAQYVEQDVQESVFDAEEPKTILDLEHAFPQIPISVSIPGYAYHHQWVKIAPANNYASSYDYPYPVYTTPPLPTNFYSPSNQISSASIPVKTLYESPEALQIESQSQSPPKDQSNSYSDGGSIQILTEEAWKTRALHLERGSTKFTLIFFFNWRQILFSNFFLNIFFSK